MEDLDLEQGYVFVRQSAWQRKLQTPKSLNAVRRFALSPQLVAHLKSEYLPDRWRSNKNGLLFPSRRGTPLDHDNLVKRYLYPLLDQLGIPRCGLHTSRHGNGSLVDRLGTPIKVRQQRLGHSDPRLTLGTYTHAVSEDDQRVAAQLGELLVTNSAPNCAQIRKMEGLSESEALVAV